MKFYPFHIGDYSRDAGHLDLEEDAIYRRLLDLYYDTEGPITGPPSRLARKIKARDHVDLVEEILFEFFDPEGDDQYRHEKADKVILEYARKAEQARENGKKGGRPKKPRKTQPVNLANPEETGSKATINHNHKPITKEEGDSPPSPPAPKSRGSRLPDDWQAPGDYIDWAVNNGLSFEQAIEQGARFADYWKSQPGAKGRKADWKATWRNWIRRSKEFSPGAPKMVRDSITKQLSDTQWGEDL